MKTTFIIALFFCMLESTQISAQTDSSVSNNETERFTFKINGYIKDLNSFSLPIAPAGFQYTQLVHNRINIKLKSNKITSALEIRNRLFWGDGPRMVPSLEKQLRNPNESVDLSRAWFSNNNAVLHSNVERLWVEYRASSWSVKAGRQRINWGMNNSWNPNDIFNAYNMFDFDYEERAGVDGVRWQYQPNELSGLDFAFSRGSKPKETTAAIKYNLNHNNYDWQLLTGLYNNRATLGLGWQGNIGGMGFKGEMQAFRKKIGKGFTINSSVELDYMTKNGWYIFTSILYNEQGITKPLNDWSALSFKNSPENLMPTRLNAMGGWSKEFTPIINGRFSVVYAPLTNLLIMIPSLSYGIATNIDIDFFAQSIMAPAKGSYKSIAHTLFVRGKWSF